MHITLVKKILADGSPCSKCADIIERLNSSGNMRFIHRIVVADLRDDSSEGVQIAKQHQVERAPFFVVEKDNGEVVVYTVYLKMVKEILEPLIGTTSTVTSAVDTDEIRDIMDSNPDLDFL
jgi:hypothetical protein